MEEKGLRANKKWLDQEGRSSVSSNGSGVHAESRLGCIDDSGPTRLPSDEGVGRSRGPCMAGFSSGLLRRALLTPLLGGKEPEGQKEQKNPTEPRETRN